MAKHRVPRSGLPSRQAILDYIAENPDGARLRDISIAFNVAKKYRARLKEELRVLEAEGYLDSASGKRVRRTTQLPPVTVVEVIGPDENGDVLVHPANWSDDQPPPIIFLQSDRRPGPAPGRGERLLVRLRRTADDQFEARTIRRLSAGGPTTFIGVFDGVRNIRPTDRRARSDYQVAPEDNLGAAAGELVLAEASNQRRHGAQLARIIERLGAAEGQGAFSRIALLGHQIPTKFSDEALELAAAAKPAPTDGRVDLRDLPLVTIDDEDARDFDDAVFAEPDPEPGNPGGWHLVVAIADVSWYVRPGDALDDCARDRGNSVYLPDQVVPMLPEQLSNGWCSLRPNEDRPCLVAHMTITKDGRMTSHRFERATMRSAHRLTYRQVHEAWTGVGATIEPALQIILDNLAGAFAALETERTRRQPLELNVGERRVVFESDGTTWRIEERPRYISHRLIEEFMVAANIAAAETLGTKKTPALFRCHDDPPPDKMAGLNETLRAMGYPAPKGQVVLPHHFNDIIKRAPDETEAELLSDLVLRSQAKAEYRRTDDGHFGLRLRNYAHFTSPIRRYADLVVHRALINGLGLGDDGAIEPDQVLENLADHISMTERRAVAAERETLDRYSVAAAIESKAESVTGRVTAVTRFGLFVLLDDSWCDGFVPKRLLPRDTYLHDERTHSLKGRKFGLTFRMGDRLELSIKEADATSGKLVLEPLGH